MKAIILAAGQGTRLKKYTENLPKGMLRFMGQTLIERQIETYHQAGIREISIVRGFAADKIKYPMVTYYENPDYTTTNMVESLLRARAEFNDDVIVSYSDILFSKEMLRGMIQASGDYVVAVDDNWKTYWKARYGRVDFDTESLEIAPDDRIISLGQDTRNIDKIDARYVGLLKFTRKGLKQITELWDRDYPLFLDKPWMLSGKHIRQAYMTDLLMALIKESYPVKASHYQNGWIEFDTNEDYERMRELAMTGKLASLIALEDDIWLSR
ncbi:MAG: phosphocholine cytidylyltransferase family protein [Prevotellaceae bacterium]|jgi:choline kinase|nr:phosphocholine cytidylyltransferase family protein [Prevotellaceae bacterium]